MSRIASSDRFVQRWAEALNVDPNEVKRIVIDAQAGRVLIVHVEKFGSEQMLEVEPPTEGVDIRIVA
jgi:hypothetical protein